MTGGPSAPAGWVAPPPPPPAPPAALALDSSSGLNAPTDLAKLRVGRILRRQAGQPLCGGLRQSLAGLHQRLRELSDHAGHTACQTADGAERGGQELRQLTGRVAGLPGLAPPLRRLP